MTYLKLCYFLIKVTILCKITIISVKLNMVKNKHNLAIPIKECKKQITINISRMKAYTRVTKYVGKRISFPLRIKTALLIKLAEICLRNIDDVLKRLER